MITKLLGSFLLFVCCTSVAQENNFTNEEIQVKLDSILIEANILYRYEITAWLATDRALHEEKLTKFTGPMIIYPAGESMTASLLDEKEKSIATYTFDATFTNPIVTVNSRKLTAEESQLLTMKNTIIEQLVDPKYEVGVPSGFALNLVLLPTDKGYKLYLLTGSSQRAVIPFGNDYLFEADKNGKITKWKKFHSRLVPSQTTMPGGETIVRITHSHLKANPFISATDICTFKLYAPLYNLNEFSVYGGGHYYLYNLEKDTLLLQED